MKKREIIVLAALLLIFLCVNVRAQDSTFKYDGIFQDVETVYVVTDDQFREGKSFDLIEKDFLKINAGSTDNEVTYLWVDKLEPDQITFIVARNPRQIVLGLGQEEKIDVDMDNTYDIILKLDSISVDAAEIFVKETSDKVSIGDSVTSNLSRFLMGGFIVGIVVVFLVIFIIVFIRYRKKKKNIMQVKPDKILKEKTKKDTQDKDSGKETSTEESRFIEQAKKFIIRARSMGYKNDQIKDMFRKKGWKEDKIDKLF